LWREERSGYAAEHSGAGPKGTEVGRGRELRSGEVLASTVGRVYERNWQLSPQRCEDFTKYGQHFQAVWRL